MIDLKQVRVLPLEQRRSLTSIDDILIDSASPPPPLTPRLAEIVDAAAQRVLAARKADQSIMLVYGAHLIKNGAQRLLIRLIEQGWLTHLATNGAGTIHDWEFAFLGRSTESVRDNVATGTFGTWDETGRYIHFALLAAGLNAEGYGRALGRFIAEDGVTLPAPAELEAQIRHDPCDPLTPARAELLHAMSAQAWSAMPSPAARDAHPRGGADSAGVGMPPLRYTVPHPRKDTSVLAAAFRHNVPMTVHPGIGYDIIATHPLFNGAAIGRAAQRDFALFADSVDRLGVVFSVGSAIMGPQVFEKSLSCVNNLRLQSGRPVVAGHTIYVVDLQDGGNWDWARGEPPKDNPAYYLRFCKSYSRMGGQMQYVQCDNATFVHHLLNRLSRS